jgi:hypothetical protein
MEEVGRRYGSMVEGGSVVDVMGKWWNRGRERDSMRWDAIVREWQI